MPNANNKFTNLTNDELYEEYDKLTRRYMYYQAAEGNWSRETADRNECEKEFYTVQDELRKRGLQV